MYVLEVKLLINKNAKFLGFLLFLLIIAVPVSFANENMTCEAFIDDGVNLTCSSDVEILRANDVYFDSSATADGTGSQNSPYKTVSSSRLGSINHFASGRYVISSGLSSVFSSSAMTFIGEDRDTTILEYAGSGNFISTSSDITFSTITLKGASIVSTGGLLTATDTVFDSGTAPVEEESDYSYYDNSYGGAIKQSISSSAIDWGGIFGGSSSSGMKITDCVFKNNCAAYGGAIYVEGGSCDIKNTRFERNSAKHYGGSIAALNNVKMTLTDCEFAHDYSQHDAGGAVYIFNCSDVNVKSSYFESCSATFGSAISSLNSRLTVVGSNFTSNKAGWQGGAIYAMYGDLTIKSSNFNDNSAKNGGGIFADNLTSFEVNGGQFKANVAYDTAGAIFAFTNKVNKISTDYIQNTANSHDDLYQTDTVDLIVGSDDYEMIQYKSSYNGVLPSKFDLRSLGYVTPVKNQGQSGNCWAFASMATLESAILKATGKQYNLSEGNLKNLANRYSDIGWDYETNNGGMYPFVFGYLTSWAGPVNASLDPTDDWDLLAPILNSAVHIQNILFLQRTSFTDNNNIKKAIMDYGAVASEIYWSNSYIHGNDYYYNGDEGRNHAICVVGWDDTRTVSGAPGPGVWIIKNSYGTTHGDGGYYYVSYYDKSLFRVYDESYNSFAIVFNDTKRFNRNYQYDAAFTDYFITGNKQMWYKNTFTSAGNDVLEAFSTYFKRVTTWQAEIFVNDELKLTQSGKSNMGYYTIDLDSPVPLKEGDNFTVSLKITCNGNADIPISESGPQYTLIKEYFKPGVSFFSTDGKSWTDFYGYQYSYGSGESGHNYFNQAACIKAFTSKGLDSDVLNTIIEITDVSSGGVTVRILDQNGVNVNTGIVEFMIGSEKYTSKVSNGKASVNIYMKSGKHNIGVVYLSNQYYNSSHDFKTVDLDKKTPVINIESFDITYPENLTVRVVTSNENGEEINIPVSVEINGIEYDRNEITLGGLKPANYTIKVTSQSTDDFNSNSESKIIHVFKNTPNLTLEFDDIEENENATVKVLMPFDSDLITLIIDNREMKLKSLNGEAVFIIPDLKVGSHEFSVVFNGNDLYNPVILSDKLNVIEKIKPEADLKVNVSVSGNDVHVEVELLNDATGNVSVLFDSKTLTKTVLNGKAVFEINNLDNGNHSFTISYSGDLKYKSSEMVKVICVNVKDNSLSTIKAENSKRAYLSGNDFQSTFTDSEGNLLNNVEVIFIVNGNEYSTRTNRFGVAKLNNSFYPGNYKIIIVNPITGENVTRNMTIVNRISENSDVKVDYTYSAKYCLRVFADNANAAGAGEIVYIKLNGKTSRAITGSDGYISYSINGLLPKTYTITAQYKGFKVSNRVVVKQILKSKNVKFKKSAKTKKFTATLKTTAGKAIKNKKITFKVKGKTYTAKTNKKGVASIKITNLNKVGKFTVKIKYLKTSIKKTVTILR